MVWFGFLFLFFLDLMEIKFGYIVFGLNGLQWVFSQNPIITGLNWVDTHLTQLIIGWVWVQLEWVSLGLLCHPYKTHTLTKKKYNRKTMLVCGIGKKKNKRENNVHDSRR